MPITYEDFGSTTSGLYAIDSSFNLYSINPANGAATLIGPTGFSFVNGFLGESANSGTLYAANSPDLYTLSTSNGTATLVGGTGGAELGALLLEGGTLYGGEDSPSLSVDTVDPTTGATTTGPAVTGATGNFWGLASDPLPSAPMPEPATLAILSTAVLGVGFLRRRS